jgi:hypothetical protein
LAPSWRAPRAALAFVAFAAIPLAACIQQVSTGDGTSSGTGATAATTATAPAGTTATGGECGTDPQTGVTLCEQISLCPSITVDQSTLPGCGFQLHAGAVMDLECVCNGDSLCPIGVPDTCDQANALLASATLLTVCEESAESRCTSVGGTDAGQQTTLNVNSCDKTCESECAGEPDCIQLCGC